MTRKLNSRGYVDTGYKKYITVEEFGKIKNWIEKIHSPPMKMCLKIMMYTGLRKGDAIRLKRQYFSNDWSVLNLPEMEKTGKPLEIYIPRFLSIQLADFYRRHNNRMNEGYLFYASYRNDSKNKYLQKSSIDLRFTQMRRELGLTQVYYTTTNCMNLHRVSPHTLRHFVAWAYYVAGGNCRKTAQEQLGHATPDITDGYIHAMQTANNREEVGEKAFTF